MEGLKNQLLYDKKKKADDAIQKGADIEAKARLGHGAGVKPVFSAKMAAERTAQIANIYRRKASLMDGTAGKFQKAP